MLKTLSNLIPSLETSLPSTVPVTEMLPLITASPDTEKPESSYCLISITLIIADNAVKLFAVKESAKASLADIYPVVVRSLEPRSTSRVAFVYGMILKHFLVTGKIHIQL